MSTPIWQLMTHLAQNQHTKVTCFCAKWVISKNGHTHPHVAGPGGGGGVLDFGLDGGVPPGHRDPNPCLEVKKVPMFRDFSQKMAPCLGIFENFCCEPRKFL